MVTEELNQRLLPIYKMLNTVHATHIKTPWTNVFETGSAVVVPVGVPVGVPVPDVVPVEVSSFTVKKPRPE